MAGMKLGIRSKIYYRSAGNFASPTWTEISAFRDLTVNAQWDTTDAPDRSTVVKGMAKTLLDLGVSGTLKCSDTATTYGAVVDALLSPTSSLDVMVLDGASGTNGVRGYRYDALVTQGNQDQAIQNALYLDVNLVPNGFADNAPQSVLVTAGSPAFTTL